MIVRYPVYERFYSWQGEGVHVGRAAYFVRLYGCPQACPWCDSAGTWHPGYRPSTIPLLTGAEVAAAVAAGSPAGAIVVITGGEPIMFDLRALTVAMQALGRRVHLETSGIAPLRGDIDWLTLSPKPFGRPPRPDIVARADEAKIIVHDPGDIETGLGLLAGLPTTAAVWLQPEWSRARDRNAAVLDAITQAVKANPRLRAGVQAHKTYRADDLDAGSDRRRIPLGGEPARGF